MVAAVKAKAAEKPKELQTTRTSGPASSKGAAMNTSSAVAKKVSSSAGAKKKGRGATHEVSCSDSSSDSSYDSSGKPEEENVLKSPEYDAFDDERTKQLKAEDCAAADATEKPRPKVRLRSRSRGQTSRSSAVAAHRPDPSNEPKYKKIWKTQYFYSVSKEQAKKLLQRSDQATLTKGASRTVNLLVQCWNLDRDCPPSVIEDFIRGESAMGTHVGLIFVDMYGDTPKDKSQAFC